jgi:hypothetical protein
MNRRASHTGGPGAWTGVIRDGKQIVWACPHRHRNRDTGDSAYGCVRSYMNAPEMWQQREDQRVAEMEARRARGWH